MLLSLWGAVAQDGVERHNQFPHGGGERKLLRIPRAEKALLEGPNYGARTRGPRTTSLNISLILLSIIVSLLETS